MVGPVRSNASVISQTHTSPPLRAAISDSTRSRTGSPSTLNTLAMSAAPSELNASLTMGEQQAGATGDSRP